MKNYFLLLFIILVIGIESCQKAAINKIPQTSSVDNNYKNVMQHSADFEEYTLEDLQGYDQQMQKDIFNEMSSSKKADIWIERIDLAISLETDQDKIDALEELKELISSALYNGNASAIGAVETWGEDHMGTFGFEPLRIIMTTLGDDGGSGPTGNIPKCKCSDASDWCVSDSGIRSHCDSGGCTSSSLGCGTLWLYGCDGRCSTAP